MKEISVKELQLNPMELIAHEWMLVTAGDDKRGYNTMTASWGHLGSIWGHGGGLPTSVIFVRPQRYTKEFVDREDLYTLCFFKPEHKKALGYLGSHSGRDGDKVAEVGFTAVSAGESVTFAQAKTTLLCKKIYRQDMTLDAMPADAIEKYYTEEAPHTMFIGEVIDIIE